MIETYEILEELIEIAYSETEDEYFENYFNSSDPVEWEAELYKLDAGAIRNFYYDL